MPRCTWCASARKVYKSLGDAHSLGRAALWIQFGFHVRRKTYNKHRGVCDSMFIAKLLKVLLVGLLSNIYYICVSILTVTDVFVGRWARYCRRRFGRLGVEQRLHYIQYTNIWHGMLDAPTASTRVDDTRHTTLNTNTRTAMRTYAYTYLGPVPTNLCVCV